MLARLKSWARQLKTDVAAIYIAGRDPRTPWCVKLVALAVAGYALSPIDLIPDFIPVLGYLDDLIIAQVGFAGSKNDAERTNGRVLSQSGGSMSPHLYEPATL